MPRFARRAVRSLASLLVVLLLGWGGLPAPAWGQQASPDPIQASLERVRDRVIECELDNGMRFLILPDREAPVVSFVTYADVGAANEPEGKTGVAHLLEHLAFKGTERIGTRNYPKEKPLLKRLDRLFDRIQAAQEAGNSQKAKRLQQQFQRVQAQAAEYVVPNEFSQIVQRAGGVGLNAATSADYTMYFYNLPANKLELWMSLESERFLEPVFRQFYKEKQVVLEERRQRVENSPIGKAMVEFLETAYTEHPYGRPVIGYERDLRQLRRQDVREFFQTYYTPGQLIGAVVGDVDPAEVKQLAQTYFGRYPSQADLPPTGNLEPEQQQPREVTLRLPSRPWYLEAYHRPAIDNPDHAVYEIVTRLLSGGRTSRLYQSLVQEQQLALNVEGISSFPGEKFPSLILFYGLTAPNSSVDALAQQMRAQIERLKTEPVTAAELERVKTQARAELVRSLDSNRGMARLLAEFEGKTGDWRNLFDEIEAIAQVTAQDVRRVAQETFQPQNRIVGRILPESADSSNE